MVDNDTVPKFSLKRIIKNLDRNELNIECQRWALAHGKCANINFYILSYFQLI